MIETKYKSNEERMTQEREEITMQSQMMESLIKGEIKRREEGFSRFSDELERRESFWNDKLRKAEADSQEFFQKAGQFFEMSVTKVNAEVEQIKKQFSTESEKVAELVSQEIQARFSSDV